MGTSYLSLVFLIKQIYNIKDSRGKVVSLKKKKKIKWNKQRKQRVESVFI